LRNNGKAFPGHAEKSLNYSLKRGGDMFIKLLIAAILVVITGCGAQNKTLIVASPIADRSWDGTVTAEFFQAASVRMKRDIFLLVNTYTTDSYARDFVEKSIADALSGTTFGDPKTFLSGNTCDHKIAFIKNMLNSKLEIWPRSIGYNYTKATPDGVRAEFHTTVSTVEDTPQTLKKQTKSVLALKWGQTPSTASGHLKINMVTSFSCNPDNNEVTFRASVPDYEVANPDSWLTGKQLGSFTINWNALASNMSSIGNKLVNADMEPEYRHNVNSIAARVSRSLSLRFNKSAEVETGALEEIYKVPYEIALSRIQRRLDSYKFVADHSRYEFHDTQKFYQEFADLKIILRIFPEENGRTASIISLAYTPVFDNFAKKPALGEAEAQRYLKSQAEFISKVVLNK
jgi:hypothetical protein